MRQLQVADLQIPRDRVDQVVRIGKTVDQRVGVQRQGQHHAISGARVSSNQAAKSACWSRLRCR
ncbi:hypothetical protein PHISP_08739 [Aspergillus sp. HF37]|nr:hypothetical protein PHISP_08739 [Aspergillus sp. HF37]